MHEDVTNGVAAINAWLEAQRLETEAYEAMMALLPKMTKALRGKRSQAAFADLLGIGVGMVTITETGKSKSGKAIGKPTLMKLLEMSKGECVK
jgi:DNA-binding transcriptional regulator YiaG